MLFVWKNYVKARKISLKGAGMAVKVRFGNCASDAIPLRDGITSTES
jgi:hypothetical protein